MLQQMPSLDRFIIFEISELLLSHVVMGVF